MIRLSRLVLMVLFVAGLAFYLPDLYWKTFDRKIERPFILYSNVIDQFVHRASDAFGNVRHWDEDGNEYDRIAYEKLVPFFYYRDLQKWGALPEEVKGLEVNYDLIRAELQVLQIRPEYLHEPQIPLYPLFESKSLFANLEDPPDMFRITSRMEFIEAATNGVNEELSAAFTRALQEAGFVFPARYIAGNPTTRKPFDEGYFVVDDRGTLFHVKRIKNKPFCVNTGVAPESGIRYLNVRENERKEFYGALITGNDEVQLITYDRYRLITLPTEGYDPDSMGFQLRTDPLNRTLVYQDSEGDAIHCVITDREYRVLRDYTYPVDRSSTRIAKLFSAILFPYALVNWSSKSDYVLFRLKLNGALGLIGILAALLILAGVRRFRSQGLRESWVDWVLVALTGVYGLLAVLIVGREPAQK